MTTYDSKKLVQEGLLEAAKLVCLSIHKAPTLTGRTEVKAIVVTGEEFQVMMSAMDVIMDKVGLAGFTDFPFMPLLGDYFGYRAAMDTGWEPIALIIGAELTISQTGWDCGSCGFPTCAEFNKFSRKNKSPGPVMGLGLGLGPSCTWKNLDFSIAADWACATLHNLNVENRIQGTFGILAHALGYLEGTSTALVLPLGPVCEFFYYSRKPLYGVLPTTPGYLPDMAYDLSYEMLRTRHPDMWESLPALAHPWIKGKGKWWERAREYIKVGPDAEIDKKEKEIEDLFLKTIADKRKELEALRKKAEEKKKG